ncbi:hypothetical protein [Streptomyces sp. NPDC058613]|uniref:hypothetical protein n=1 Tax=unclassified Streptomyces TaxID=2593676 RepID=UPI0036597D78
MVNWARMYDWYSDVDRVPELLSLVERKDDAEAWTELWHRLILERDLLSPAGIAALPRLARLAAGSTEARHLASGQRARTRCGRRVISGVCGVCRSGAVMIQRAASREGGLARIGTRREVNPDPRHDAPGSAALIRDDLLFRQTDPRGEGGQS